MTAQTPSNPAPQTAASADDATPPRLVMVGLGKMGGRMAARLARKGAEVIGFDPSPEARRIVLDLVDDPELDAPERRQPKLFDDLAEAVAAMPAPRIVWLMLPAGEPTSATINRLRALLDPGDLIVDGGNANYHDSMAHGRALAEVGLEFSDCGVSGGIWGLDNGYCLMYGATDAVAPRLAPLMRLLGPTPKLGWLHTGPIGSGHFTKMVHNGIEYGMMEAFAEGFSLLQAKKEFDFDIHAIADLWRHGSVVRSWLLDLTAHALAKPDALAGVAPYVTDSGEGRWTVEEAIHLGIPTPVIAMSLMSRFDSQGKADTANKLLALMRHAFGGHDIKST